MPHRLLHYSACFLLGPLKVFSTSFTSRNYQPKFSHPFSSDFIIQWCIKNPLVLWLLFHWIVWGWNSRMCFKYQGVHRFHLTCKNKALIYSFGALMKTHPVTSYHKTRGFCWGCPSGNLLHSQDYFYYPGGFSMCPNSVLFYQCNICSWTQLQWSWGSAGWIWNLSITIRFFWEQPVLLCGTQVAPADEGQGSLSALNLKLEEEHPALLSFNLCSKGFVLIKFYNTLQKWGKSAILWLQMRGRGAQSNVLMTESAYGNQDDKPQLQHLSFLLLLRNASVKEKENLDTFYHFFVKARLFPALPIYLFTLPYLQDRDKKTNQTETVLCPQLTLQIILPTINHRNLKTVKKLISLTSNV